MPSVLAELHQMIRSQADGRVGEELRRLTGEIRSLRQQQHNEREALPALLRRLTEIERALKLTELHIPPRLTRRRPLED
jgi:hypothetical protein